VKQVGEFESFEEFVKEYYPSYDPEEFGKIRCVSCGRTLKEIFEKDGVYGIEDGLWLDSSGDYTPAFKEFAGCFLCYACYDSEVCYYRAVVNLQGIIIRLHDHFYTINSEEVSEETWEKYGDLACQLAEELHEALFWTGMGYRGYYDIDESVLENWVIVADDCILAGSEDAEDLEKFDKELRRLLEKNGITWARVITATSNLFSAGYTLLAKKDELADKAPLVYCAVYILKQRYRDYRRFVITALTGKTSVKSFTKEDQLLYEAWQKLQKGEDPQKILEYVKQKSGEGKAQ